MGNTGSRDTEGKLTKAEIERVKRRFERQTGKSGRMSLSDIQRIPSLSGNLFVARIFQQCDTDQDGFISVDDFICAVEGLGRLHNDEERLLFAFRLFDADSDGYISLEDLLDALQTSRGAGNSKLYEKTVKSLMQEYDTDSDGKLSFPEFKLLIAGNADRLVVG